MKIIGYVKGERRKHAKQEQAMKWMEQKKCV